LIFGRHRTQLVRVDTLMRIYYFAILGMANILALPNTIHTELYPDYRWPLSVFNGADEGKVKLFSALALFASCAFAGIRPVSQLARVLAFCSLFLVNAAVNSDGGTTHLYQFWLWSALALAMIPSERLPWISQTERRRRHRRLIGWWAAQSVVLLFYGLSGIWKCVGLVDQIFKGEPHLLSAKGLAYHLASETLRAGAHPILGDWLLNHEALSPLLAGGVILIQLSCLVAISHAGLRKWVGLALIGFHLGTYLFLSITYPTNVFLIGVLLVTNPFANSFKVDFRPSFSSALVYGMGLYVLVAFASVFVAPGGELFPIFNGHWFIRVPYEIQDYGLLVRSLDGKALDPPVYVEAIYPRLRVWPFAAYGSLQNWGQARTPEEQSKAKKFALSQIFHHRAFQAEFRKRRIDPLDFVQDHRVLSEQTLESVDSPGDILSP
jgi:hypothetical protein